jgi:ribonuclease HII
MTKTTPDFTLETALPGIVAGVDEVGRGPLAGPVIAAAVILDRDSTPPGINDSKKLSVKKRELLYDLLYAGNHLIGVGIASVEEIDQINILQAAKLAMQRAVANLPRQPEQVLVDGNQLPAFPCPAHAVIRGDAISLSIASASIIAKVTRDRLMQQLSLLHPYYSWEKNAGYGTAAHLEAMHLHGITPHHRKSFAPVKHYLTSVLDKLSLSKTDTMLKNNDSKRIKSLF